MSPIALAHPAPASAATAAATVSSATTELSGASGNGVTSGDFGAWRGAPAEISGTWSDDDANSIHFWQLQPGTPGAAWTKPLDVAVGAIDAGETWQAAASGAYDARWTQSLTLLKQLRGSDGTTYIRFAHEMNGNWYPWSVTATNYTYFDAAWKRYRALQRAIFPSAKLVFSVNKESAYNSGIAWTKYFPGKQYVDVLSVDYYNQYPYISTQADWDASLNAVDSFGAPKGIASYLAYAKSQGLPLSVSEWSGDSEFGDSPIFVTNMLDFFRSNAGDSAGHVAYDILFNVGGYDQHFQLFGPDEAMPNSSAAYKAFFTSASTKASTSSSSTQTTVTTTPSAILKAGSTMSPGASLASPAGHYTFNFQTDGNLVVRNSAGQAIWNARTQAKGGTRLVVQSDANLVLYTATGKAVWNTRTNGHGAGADLDMQSDGNLVLYSAVGKALWASK